MNQEADSVAAGWGWAPPPDLPSVSSGGRPHTLLVAPDLPSLSVGRGGAGCRPPPALTSFPTGLYGNSLGHEPRLGQALAAHTPVLGPSATRHT